MTISKVFSLSIFRRLSFPSRHCSLCDTTHLSFDTLSEVGAGISYFYVFHSLRFNAVNRMKYIYNSRQNGRNERNSRCENDRVKGMRTNECARTMRKENTKQNIINTFVAHSSHRRCTARKSVCRKQNYINIDCTTTTAAHTHNSEQRCCRRRCAPSPYVRALFQCVNFELI